MSGRIQIDYNGVSTLTAQHGSAISRELDNLNREYNGLMSSLRSLDSASNAAFMEAMERNRQKAAATAQILQKLLTFIGDSARQVQAQEQAISSSFSNAQQTKVNDSVQ